MGFNLNMAVLLGAGMLAASVQAETVPGVSVSGGALDTYGPLVAGYRFQVNQDITVTALGAYDADGGGFEGWGAHAVALYQEDGTRIAGTTVWNEDPLAGGFRYRDIDPVALQAGKIYVVAANVYGGYYKEPFLYNATITSGPGVTYLNSAYASSLNFIFPEWNVSTNGYFGGNFLYEAPSPVPEPASALMLVAGLAAVRTVVARRRARQS